jgi:predicted GIY-YIG superfamily endonuclease
MNKIIYVYVLKLEQGKYYIGKSSDPGRRIEEHSNSSGSDWTKIYKPIEIIDLRQTLSPFEEDRLTIEYMAQYGIDNVRGGTFCKLKLEDEVRYVLTQMIWTAQDKCLNCGSSYHFRKNCKYILSDKKINDRTAIYNGDVIQL